jgi:hypothetical protein
MLSTRQADYLLATLLRHNAACQMGPNMQSCSVKANAQHSVLQASPASGQAATQPATQVNHSRQSCTRCDVHNTNQHRKKTNFDKGSSIRQNAGKEQATTSVHGMVNRGPSILLHNCRHMSTNKIIAKHVFHGVHCTSKGNLTGSMKPINVFEPHLQCSWSNVVQKKIQRVRTLAACSLLS